MAGLISKQAMQELGCFQLPGIEQILAMWGCALSYNGMNEWRRNVHQSLVTHDKMHMLFLPFAGP